MWSICVTLQKIFEYSQGTLRIFQRLNERTGMLLSITSIIATWRKGDLRPTPDPSLRLYFSTECKCHFFVYLFIYLFIVFCFSAPTDYGFSRIKVESVVLELCNLFPTVGPFSDMIRLSWFLPLEPLPVINCITEVYDKVHWSPIDKFACNLHLYMVYFLMRMPEHWRALQWNTLLVGILA